MINKLKEIHRTLNRSIFIGERYKRNMQNLLTESYMLIALGVVMLLVNILNKDYATSIVSILFLVAGIVDIYFLKSRGSREFSLILSYVTVILVLTYCILFVGNGFAYLWTLLIPLSICYVYGVKEGICLTMYFQILFIVAFYTPLRQHLEGNYLPIVMERFPILFFFNFLLTGFVMYQYHKSALFEIDYAEKLNQEVERQTRKAVEQSRIATERANQLEILTGEMVETLARTIDAKDQYTNGHSFRVSKYSVALAERLGWDEDEIRELEREGLLHDIGKIGVPDAVLNKPGRLTDEEFSIIKSHTTVGRGILEGVQGMDEAAKAAAYHHERYDGRGYPEGLKGKDIPSHARLISIADAYDAMHSNRIYRKALSDDVIREELKKGSGTQFDPDYLPAFLELLDEGKLA